MTDREFQWWVAGFTVAGTAGATFAGVWLANWLGRKKDVEQRAHERAQERERHEREACRMVLRDVEDPLNRLRYLVDAGCPIDYDDPFNDPFRDLLMKMWRGYCQAERDAAWAPEAVRDEIDALRDLAWQVIDLEGAPRVDGPDFEVLRSGVTALYEQSVALIESIRRWVRFEDAVVVLDDGVDDQRVRSAIGEVRRENERVREVTGARARRQRPSRVEQG